MAETIVHIGVAFRYLRRVIEERGNHGIIEQDGRGLSKGEALAWIDQQVTQGRAVSSACSTPLADGSCPGHPAKRLIGS